MKNFLYTSIICSIFILSACSSLSTIEKKHEKVIAEIPEIISLETSDSLSSMKKWSTKSPLIYYQEKRGIQHNLDSVWVRKEKWAAHGRISPNSLQEIDKIEILYIRDSIRYRKTEKLKLLMFNSSHKTTINIYMEDGTIETIKKDGPYDLFKYGLGGKIVLKK